MKSPTFLSATGLALALAAIAGVAFTLLVPLVASTVALRLLISVTGLFYLLWLLRGSRARAGRATAVAAWACLSVASWVLAPSVLTCLFLHVALLWLVRSLIRYQSAIPALLDLCVSAVAVAAATWAAGHSGSVFLTAWSFFLVQAVAMAIPARLPQQRRVDGARSDNEAFEHARRRADEAFRELIMRSGR